MLNEIKKNVAIPACGIALASASLAQGGDTHQTQATVEISKATASKSNSSVFDTLDLRKAYDAAFGEKTRDKVEKDSKPNQLKIDTPANEQSKPSKSLALIPAFLLGMVTRWRKLFNRSEESPKGTTSSLEPTSQASAMEERLARAAKVIKSLEDKPNSADPVKAKSFSFEKIAEKPYLKGFSKLWKLWENVADKLSTPWNTIAKFGVPTVAATCGVVWFQSFVQLGILGVEIFGGVTKPILGMAALLIPAIKANSILSGIEKLLHKTPLSGWKREAILRPAQGALLASAAIWAQAMDLTPLTYSIWGAAVVGCGLLAKKLAGNISRSTWTAMATALVLPWSHVLTLRDFDVTVKAAGPDPEVAAWNVTTDLSVADHWKRLAFLKAQNPPSGGTGMVFLNRDVPLLIPSHRNANAFNGDFTNLVGKKVRITTTGAWLKPLSPKLQPTIVAYKVLE